MSTMFQSSNISLKRIIRYRLLFCLLEPFCVSVRWFVTAVVVGIIFERYHLSIWSTRLKFLTMTQTSFVCLNISSPNYLTTFNLWWSLIVCSSCRIGLENVCDDGHRRAVTSAERIQQSNEYCLELNQKMNSSAAALYLTATFVLLWGLWLPELDHNTFRSSRGFVMIFLIRSLHLLQTLVPIQFLEANKVAEMSKNKKTSLWKSRSLWFRRGESRGNYNNEWVSRCRPITTRIDRCEELALHKLIAQQSSSSSSSKDLFHSAGSSPFSAAEPQPFFFDFIKNDKFETVSNCCIFLV